MNQHEVDRLWDLGQIFTKVFAGCIQGGVNRSKMTKWLDTADWKRTQTYLEQWEEFNHSAYLRRRDAGVECVMVHMFKAAEAGRISRDEVLQTLAESLFANLDVTTHVITSCVILLADNAEVTAELRREFAQHEGNVDEYLGKRNTLLYYCLLESLRLQPVLSYSFPERPPRQKVIGGYKIPKNVKEILISSFLPSPPSLAHEQRTPSRLTIHTDNLRRGCPCHKHPESLLGL